MKFDHLDAEINEVLKDSESAVAFAKEETTAETAYETVNNETETKSAFETETAEQTCDNEHTEQKSTHRRVDSHVIVDDLDRIFAAIREEAGNGFTKLKNWLTNDRRHFVLKLCAIGAGCALLFNHFGKVLVVGGLVYLFVRHEKRKCT